MVILQCNSARIYSLFVSTRQRHLRKQEHCSRNFLTFPMTSSKDDFCPTTWIQISTLSNLAFFKNYLES